MKMILMVASVFVVAAVGVGTYFILDNTIYNSGEPVIYNCGLKIATLDGTTSANGTANNNHILGFCGWGMRDFNMSTMPNGELQLQACFKWYVDKDAEVLSCVDGVVKRIEWQEYDGGDYTVQIEPNIKGFGKPDWFVNMDHIIPIDGLKVGSRVRANQVIGKPGEDQGAKWMFELEFRKHSDGQHYPTARFWADEIKDEYGQRMVKMMNDLEDNVYHVARGTNYDYDSMIYGASWLEAIPGQYYDTGYPGNAGYDANGGGSRDRINHNKTKVSWGISTNNISGTTAELTITFNKDVSLTTGHIIVEHAKKGLLSGSGKVWTLEINNIDIPEIWDAELGDFKLADDGKVVITLASPDGYNITPITKKIAVSVVP